MISTNKYWLWDFRPNIDANEQLRNGCAAYYRRFQQWPNLVVVPPDTPLIAHAGLDVQTNFFISAAYFCFAKPGGGA